nr:heparinase II/III family protein [uncultured Cohaesibacter sp.]
MFVECTKALPERLQPFCPAWPLSGTEAKETLGKLPGQFFNQLLETAKKHEGEWPGLPASRYLDFTRNGNRERFEAPYMQRRRMLNAYAMAELVSDKTTYLDSIIDGTMLLCEESGWQLPAHNSYIRDTACAPLPDPDRPVIDLFAAETGAQLAMLLHLFGKQFDDISPLIKGRIRSELQKRIIEPYLNEHFWWMGNGDEPMCNWTAWCTQNILLTSFLIPLEEDTRRTIMTKAAYSLDCFLKDYGQDGACEEGVLYYRHAGLCLFNALNILTQVAPDAFSSLWNEPKIRNIAEFIVHMHVEDERYFNFADAPAKAGHCGAREYLFGKAIRSDILSTFALFDWQQDPCADLPDEINLFYRYQTACALANLSPDAAKQSTRPSIPDHFYQSIGLLTARDDHFTLAAKAGDNGDSHNHNDVGSVTLYKDGKPVLIDLGVETYTAKTFSPRRYEIWTMQSGYHNLPSFEGVDQQDGLRFAARDVTAQLTDDLASLSMELAGAYPTHAGVESYHRTVSLIKGQHIEILDQFKGDKRPTLSLMLAIEPQIKGNLIILDDVCNTWLRRRRIANP